MLCSEMCLCLPLLGAIVTAPKTPAQNGWARLTTALPWGWYGGLAPELQGLLIAVIWTQGMSLNNAITVTDFMYAPMYLFSHTMY